MLEDSEWEEYWKKKRLYMEVEKYEQIACEE